MAEEFYRPNVRFLVFLPNLVGNERIPSALIMGALSNFN